MSPNITSMAVQIKFRCPSHSQETFVLFVLLLVLQGMRTILFSCRATPLRRYSLRQLLGPLWAHMQLLGGWPWLSARQGREQRYRQGPRAEVPGGRTREVCSCLAAWRQALAQQFWGKGISRGRSAGAAGPGVAGGLN